MGQISLFVSVIIVPTSAFVANAVLRYGRGVAQSAAADLLLLLIVFDATVIISSEEFKPLVASPELRTGIIAVHVGLLFIGLIAWISSVTLVERRIGSAFDYKTRKYVPGFPIICWIGSWVIAATLVGAHVTVFTYTA